MPSSPRSTRVPPGRTYLLLISDSMDLVNEIKTHDSSFSILSASPLDPDLADRDLVRARLDAAAAVIVEWSDDTMPLFCSLRRPAREKFVPLFALGGNNHLDRAAAIRIGADAYIALPYSGTGVEAKIRAYYRMVESMREEMSGQPDQTTDGKPNVPAPTNGQADSGVSVNGAGGAPQSTQRAEKDENHTVLRAGRLSLDRSAHTFRVGGLQVMLTSRQFDMMEVFLSSPGICLDRMRLLEKVWGLTFDPESGVIERCVSDIRQKLRPFELENMIVTIRGVGYRLD